MMTKTTDTTLEDEYPDPPVYEDLDAAIRRHYLTQQEGALPPLSPHPGYADPVEAQVAPPPLAAGEVPRAVEAPAPCKARRPVARRVTGIAYFFARRSSPAQPSFAIVPRAPGTGICRSTRICTQL
jgi:hypothetical protein